jgi:hypothetical protein
MPADPALAIVIKTAERRVLLEAGRRLIEKEGR